MHRRGAYLDGPRSIVNCTFNNPGGSGLQGENGRYLGLTNCTFTNGTPFTSSIPYQMENTSGIIEKSSGNVFYNGASGAGTSANLNAIPAIQTTYPNPELPFPGASCVNIQNAPYNAAGNGSTDDTAAINNALANNAQVYFPPGNYRVSSTITVAGGKSLWGVCTGAVDSGHKLYLQLILASK